MAVADRTHDILRAACRVIAERGCDGMRMGDVARSAGVSSALVHYYFDTRSELLRRAFLYADEQVDAFVQCRRPASRDAARAARDRRALVPRRRRGGRAELADLVGDAARGALRAGPAARRRGVLPLVGRGGGRATCAPARLRRSTMQASAARLCALVDGLAQQALLGGIGRARARALVRHAIASELHA